MQVATLRMMLGQRVQGERSEYREMRRKEMVGTNHKELACAFSSSLDFIPWLECGWEIEQDEQQRVPVRGQRPQPGGWSAGIARRGWKEEIFRMEPPGSFRLCWGLGVTSKFLEKGTERVVVPVEGLRTAEG